MAKRTAKAKAGVAREDLANHHGYWIAPACKILEDLRIGGSVAVDGDWHPILGHSELLNFELETGTISERYAYNDRSIRRALDSGKSVLGEHRGFSDLFVPFGRAPHRGVLVVGPFAQNWPTSSELRERWLSLTGTSGQLSDPRFSHYVATTLGIAVLEPKARQDLTRLLEWLCRLIGSEGDAEVARREIHGLRGRLLDANLVLRTWEAARLMIDERTQRIWSTSARRGQRPNLGLGRVPQHVAVGLLASARAKSDPLADLLRRNAFQRAAVAFAFRQRDVICGKLGDHGVSFLFASRGSGERTERWFREFAERSASLSRRSFGLDIRFGIGTPSPTTPLPEQYQLALAAAGVALTEGTRLHKAGSANLRANPVAQLRRELVHGIETDSQVLPQRFERFLEVVGANTGFRPELARIHLDVAIEQMQSPLLASGVLDPKTTDELNLVLERRVAEAHTLNDLFNAYRSIVGDLVHAIGSPALARIERNLARAQDYLDRGYAARVSVASAAKVAGFAPSYFAFLFRKKHGLAFTHYVARLRLDRAKQLLTDTGLGLEAIAKLSGFERASYLSRVFRRQTGETPIEFRQRTLYEAKKPRKATSNQHRKVDPK